jgi:hypothetical protein
LTKNEERRKKRRRWLVGKLQPSRSRTKAGALWLRDRGEGGRERGREV